MREQGGSPIPTTTNQAYLQRDVVVEVKEVVWILGRQPIWRQMRCDSLSHQENTWARFVCQGSSAAVVQQGLKHETQPMRQPVMSFAESKDPWRMHIPMDSWPFPKMGRCLKC